MWVEFYNDLLKNSSKELTQKIQKTLADYFKDKYAVPLIPKTLKMEMMLRDSLRKVLNLDKSGSSKALRSEKTESRKSGMTCNKLFALGA